MTSLRKQEDDIQTEIRRQRNEEHMESVRKGESENVRLRHNVFKTEEVKRSCRLFQDNDFSSDYYFDVGKINRQCAHCRALHCFDETIGISTPLEPGFSSWCQHGKFKLPPIFNVPTVLRQLMTTPDTVLKTFCQSCIHTTWYCLCRR